MCRKKLLAQLPELCQHSNDSTLTRRTAQLNLNSITLTPDEQTHVDNGGRVFVVQETPTNNWCVVSISKKGRNVLLKPQDADGYLDKEEAKITALAIANLSQDSPLVRMM